MKRGEKFQISMATNTSDGLRFQCKEMRCFCGNYGIGNYLHVKGPDGTWYEYGFTHNEPECIPDDFEEDGSPKTFSVRPWTSYRCKEVAIIYEEPQLDEGVTYNVQMSGGVLVAIQEVRGDTIYGLSICAAWQIRLIPTLHAQIIADLNRIYNNRPTRDDEQIWINKTNRTMMCAFGKEHPVSQR
ncbi:hypothetical protein DL766_001245 [Monosporascus sp. MC13-8B]|uniref:Uncharacterized protein n=1 Tax=Monosporascus cannonballus TaxID=155416 RepID=A0ABY0HE40_9PEZI|nr:hypothetical protein DL762_003696 [Monosporascus cannonballus]RYO96957.1 hypothetical protein DL763_002994 [Monosporascus cannonballus]RYP37948.1 hypothetical protein DL766_001245 [Monosporascus sp. MC13-8B]